MDMEGGMVPFIYGMYALMIISLILFARFSKWKYKGYLVAILGTMLYCNWTSIGMYLYVFYACAACDWFHYCPGYL